MHMYAIVDMNESLAVTIEESCISDVMLPSKFALEYMELVAGLSVRVGNEVGQFHTNKH